MDEVFIKINGKQHYLWRAVDQDNDELNILVTKKRDKKSALKFFKKYFKCHGTTANRIVTDKLKSYPAALREMDYKIPHDTARYHNNVAENSHQKTRQQQRHLLKARHYRFFRDREFEEWAEVTCAKNLGITT